MVTATTKKGYERIPLQQCEDTSNNDGHEFSEEPSFEKFCNEDDDMLGASTDQFVLNEEDMFLKPVQKLGN